MATIHRRQSGQCVHPILAGWSRQSLPSDAARLPPGATWTFFAGAPGQAAGCYINGNQTPGPQQGLDGLQGLRVTGSSSSISQSSTYEIANGFLVSATDAGDPLSIGGNWTQAEFNVFGYAGGTTITFNQGASIVPGGKPAAANVDPVAPAPWSELTQGPSITRLASIAPPAVTSIGLLPSLSFKESPGITWDGQFGMLRAKREQFEALSHTSMVWLEPTGAPDVATP